MSMGELGRGNASYSLIIYFPVQLAILCMLAEASVDWMYA